MGSDDLFKKRKGNRKKRKENSKKLAPYRYLIVCEGKKTEPKYFEGIKNKINEKYTDAIKVKEKIDDIKVIGTGRNTQDLVKFTIGELERLKNQGELPYGNVWVVFDKDDFLDEQFNNAIYQAQAKGFHVGWSNEAIELWFVLHFEFLNTAIHRYQYIDKLNHYFKKFGLNKGRYEKNLENIFDILCKYGDMQKAIERSVKLEKIYLEEGLNTESKMNPGNNVYKLVQELIAYID
ncbi:RloB family protein [Crassaminicella profunda]|uniref:RloB family protein n=1 Tax=Crassaminicella profunda TaxID=1286698 RepID=UPI001CA796C3|nr:RloB family protein [Crassaminicella profunda]QZY54969.1 RloB family protein [Crassaminicella profunda]